MKQTIDITNHTGKLPMECEIVKHDEYPTLLAIYKAPNRSGRGFQYSLTHIPTGKTLGHYQYVKVTKGLAQNILNHKPFGDLLRDLKDVESLRALGRGGVFEALCHYCVAMQTHHDNSAPPGWPEWINTTG